WSSRGPLPEPLGGGFTVHYVTFVLSASLKFSFIEVFTFFSVLVAIRVNFLTGGQHVTKVGLLVG
ncbi:hypothetical protein, partial [Mycobacterium gordonae]